jgi:hypothetical protein
MPWHRPGRVVSDINAVPYRTGKVDGFKVLERDDALKCPVDIEARKHVKRSLCLHIRHGIHDAQLAHGDDG